MQANTGHAMSDWYEQHDLVIHDIHRRMRRILIDMHNITITTTSVDFPDNAIFQ
jgi:hypothetical protein